MSGDLLTRLIAAGAPADVIADVARLEARAEIAEASLRETQAADETRRARQRDGNAERQRAFRERNASSRDVTRYARDVTPEPAPSPPPLLSPQTPQTTPPPLPHPEGSDAYTRGAVARLVLAAIVAGCREAIEAKASGKRRWPKDMPPPPGVSDDCWAGFIEHRRAKRNALTFHAYRLLLGKLIDLSSDEWPPGRLIDTAIDRGWLTVFPPKENETRNGHHRPSYERPSGAIESRRRLREQHGVDVAHSADDG